MTPWNGRRMSVAFLHFFPLPMHSTLVTLASDILGFPSKTIFVHVLSTVISHHVIMPCLLSLLSVSKQRRDLSWTSFFNLEKNARIFKEISFYKIVD